MACLLCFRSFLPAHPVSIYPAVSRKLSFQKGIAGLQLRAAAINAGNQTRPGGGTEMSSSSSLRRPIPAGCRQSPNPTACRLSRRSQQTPAVGSSLRMAPRARRPAKGRGRRRGERRDRDCYAVKEGTATLHTHTKKSAGFNIQRLRSPG